MSIGINVKINDNIYKEASRYFGKGRGKLNRNAFINQALAFFVRVNDRRKLAAEFKRASLADQKDPKLQAERREWERAALTDLGKLALDAHEPR
jgi:hypothetical protein